MPILSPLGRRQTVAVLLTLTFVTGLVDAVSYLRRGRLRNLPDRHPGPSPAKVHPAPGAGPGARPGRQRLTRVNRPAVPATPSAIPAPGAESTA